MRRILIGFFVLIIIVVGGALGAFYLTPSSTLAGIAADQVREATGRDLVIEGPIERRLYPSLGFTVSAVRLGQADGWTDGDDADMISAESASVDVRVVPLLGGGVEVADFRLVKPVVRLERRADGSANWDDLAAPGAADGGGGGAADTGAGDQSDGGAADAADDALALIVESAVIEDGLFVLNDAQTGQSVEMKDIDLTVSLPATGGALTVDGSAVVNDAPATLSVALDSLAAVQAGQTANADVSLTGDGLEISVTGAFGDLTGASGPPTANGDLTFSLDGDPDKTAWLRDALGDGFRDVGGVAATGAFAVSEQAVEVDMAADAQIRDRPTKVLARVGGGAGWLDGGSELQIVASATNAALDVGYDGVARLAEDGAPTVKGAWRGRIDDVPAAFALIGAPAPDEGDPLAKLSKVDMAGEIDLTPSQVAASVAGAVAYDGREVSIDGDVSGGADWAEGGPVRADLTVASEALFTASWAGAVSPPPAGAVTPTIDGRVEFDSSALTELLTWLGAPPVDAPDGAFRAASLAADIAVTPDRTRVSSAEIRLDDAVVTGEMTAITAAGRKPRISARVATNALDLRPYTGLAADAPTTSGGGGGADPTPVAAGGRAGSGWSTDPIDLAVLDLIDADLFVSTDGVATDFVTVGRSRAEVRLAGGRLDLEIPQLGFYGGSVTGTATLDGSGAPGIDLDLTAEGVSLRPFLTQTAGFDWLEGSGAARIDVAGQGASTKELMSSLNGTASMNLTNGAIVGFNLAAIVRNVTSLGLASGGGPQKTDFAEISGTFQISDGVAQNNDFTLVGPLVRLTGAGSIDIGEQSLNYRAVPKAVATLRGQGGTRDLAGIAFPVLISGPWADPSIRPDLSGGAIASVEGILADPQGAAAFLTEIEGVGDLIEGGDVGEVIESLTGEGGVEEAAGQILNEVIGGGDGDGGGVEEAVGGAVESLLGGGDDDKPDVGGALKGLFGN